MIPDKKVRALVVDDDPNMGRFLTSYLARRGLDVGNATTGEEAIRVLRVYDPQLVLLDLSSPGMGALDILERIKQIKPEIGVLVLSAQHDPELIFRASKLGADDYLNKPFEPKDLGLRINKILDRQRLPTEVPQLRDQVRRNSDFTGLFGTSPRMEEVKHTVEQVADTTATVLIRGESGTGKEVVARMIYAQSGRGRQTLRKS